MTKYKSVKSGAYHLGNRILQKIEEKEISKSELGRKLGVTRQNIQSVLNRESMDTELLTQICKVLNHPLARRCTKAWRERPFVPLLPLQLTQ